MPGQAPIEQDDPASMNILKKAALQLIYNGWPGDVLRAFDRFLRARRKVMGLTNPVHMSHVVTRQAGGVYLSQIDNYIALRSGRKKMLRFDPDLFEADITFLMRSLIRPDDIVLDIGANIGFHTVTMAQAASRGHLYAFEPVAEMATQNSINCGLNRLDNVTIVHCAMGNKPGEMEMRVNVAGQGLQGTSTLLEENAHVQANPDFYRPRKIRTFRLDDIIDGLNIKGRIGFVKIDTEGFDALVLEGASETIRAHKPVMIVEAHSTRLAQTGKSWQWFLDTFPDHHILIIHPLTRAKPYLHLEPLTADQPEISVNLLLLPRADFRVPEV